MTKSTDNERAAELNSKVTSLGAITPAGQAGQPGFQNGLVDRALGMLAANNELLGIKATRSNP